MTHIFISYSRKDGKFANRLAKHLKTRGFDIWIDDRNIGAGDVWQEKIEEGIATCGAVIVIWSARARASTWVNNEVLRAAELHKPIFPVRIDEERLPLVLVGTQAIDVPAHAVPADAFLAQVAQVVSPKSDARGQNVLDAPPPKPRTSTPPPTAKANSATQAATSPKAATEDHPKKPLPTLTPFYRVFFGLSRGHASGGMAYIFLHLVGLPGLLVDVAVAGIASYMFSLALTYSDGEWEYELWGGVLLLGLIYGILIGGSIFVDSEFLTTADMIEQLLVPFKWYVLLGIVVLTGIFFALLSSPDEARRRRNDEIHAPHLKRRG